MDSIQKELQSKKIKTFEDIKGTDWDMSGINDNELVDTIVINSPIQVVSATPSLAAE